MAAKEAMDSRQHACICQAAAHPSTAAQEQLWHMLAGPGWCEHHWHAEPTWVKAASKGDAVRRSISRDRSKDILGPSMLVLLFAGPRLEPLQAACV